MPQAVSAPEASPSLAMVVPVAQAVQTLVFTYWFTAHLVAVQVVSAPEASPSLAIVVPAAHAAHALVFT